MRNGWPERHEGFLWTRGDQRVHVLVTGIRVIGDSFAFVEGFQEGHDGRGTWFVEKRDVQEISKAAA